ncbi:MAG TPA: YebC/PmpR family DNA-binding transcriptional regulator [Candidatus Saccharimonadales bacterium]|nr:YebC/PmpR family DNA-binding transcriptional regulator [Candidatus Saccharimonadales bacterium]
MSGHSKWSQIKRQKGVSDVKRGAAFTKLGKAITIAVKQGGGIGDPAQNFRLRLAIDTARSANMPKDNIDRAIARAVNRETGDVEEVVYEGFAPGGVSVIVEAATDNSMRTTAEVKSIFSKAGASFGQPGSVAYQFDQVGEIFVEKNGKTIDDIFLIAAEAGAEDVEELGDEVAIYTKVNALAAVQKNLATQLGVKSAQITRKPKMLVEVSGEQSEKVTQFLEKLEELEDVQKVYANIA